MAIFTAGLLGALWLGAGARADAPPGRYTLSGDGKTVFDLKTNLTWQRDDSGSNRYSVDKSNSYCGALEPSNYWRVPSRLELESLVDTTRQEQGGVPTIDRSAFPSTQTDSYCTGTTLYGLKDDQGKPVTAYFIVFFSDGTSLHYESEKDCAAAAGACCLVRCVH